MTATDAAGSGAPFAGRVVTLTYALGTPSSPVTVTLDADGVGALTYTAGAVPGVDTVTAEIANLAGPRVATATVKLLNTPLTGALDYTLNGQGITYRFVVRNASAVDPQVNLVVTGAVPADTS